MAHQPVHTHRHHSTGSPATQVVPVFGRHGRHRPRKRLSLESVLALTAGLLALVAVASTAAALALTAPRTTAPPLASQARDDTRPGVETVPSADAGRNARPAPTATPSTTTTPPEPVAEPARTVSAPVSDADLATARSSSVELVNGTCGKAGSGWTFAPGYVATNAHVVRGGQGAVEVRSARGTASQGRVVSIDRAADVAVVYAPALDAAPLHWSAEDVPPGTPVAWAGYPAERFTVGIGEIRSHTPAIVDGVTVDAYLLSTAGAKGMSGGPMVGPGGVVYGMNVGVADGDSAAMVETGAHIAPFLHGARGLTASVATGACA